MAPLEGWYGDLRPYPPEEVRVEPNGWAPAPAWPQPAAMPTFPQVAPGPAVAPVERSGGLPVLPVVAAALVLVVVTTVGLLWLNSRNSGDVTATNASVTAPTASAAGTGSSPEDTAGQPAGETTGQTAGAAANVPPAAASSAASSDQDVVRALDDLLDESAAARGDVAATALGLQSCRVPPEQAAATFRRAGDDRARLAAEATALPVSGTGDVPGLGDAVRAFIALQQASARADTAFADWADEVEAAGCRGQARHTTNWDLANRYSEQASAAKAKFVRLWNPIAAERGMRSRSAGAI